MDKISIPSHLVIKDGIQGLGVFATADLKKGQVAFKLSGKIVDRPTRTSVQIGDHQHIEDHLAAFMNHSCMANTEVNKQDHTFICTRDIKQGEELTFDYHQNEDTLAAPFTCHCCGKKIIGKKMVAEVNKV